MAMREVCVVDVQSQFVSSLKRHRDGAGTRLLMTPADYCAPFGPIYRFLTKAERHCRDISEMPVDASLSTSPNPHHVRAMIIQNIEAARGRLVCGEYPTEQRQNIERSLAFLAIELSPYTRNGLSQRKNFDAERQRDRHELELETSRNEWLVKEVRKRFVGKVSLGKAAEDTAQDLKKHKKYRSVAINAKQIKNICADSGIVSRQIRHPRHVAVYSSVPQIVGPAVQIDGPC
jgi:hypothetical protein